MSESVTVQPLSVHIGAEIQGLDLTQPLSDAQRAAVRNALLKWKVIFFREQALSHAQHVQFARQFGDPTPGHVVFGNEDDYPEVYSIAKHRTANKGKSGKKRIWTDWHADLTAAVNPPFASILRGEIVPPYGGDTHWVNLAVAYNALSPALRDFIDGLHAVHRFNLPEADSKGGDYNARLEANNLVAEHPLITIHPETGERVLFVSPNFVKSILELKLQEGQALLEMLWEHAVRPEFMVRFKWAPGSIAFWDNRATLHLAPSDIFATDFDRQFYRVTLNGQVPVGVDGQVSKRISGQRIEPV